MTKITVGKKIPDFTIATTKSELIKFHDLFTPTVKNIVLYFYPKDNTSGCTTEAEDFRDHFKKLQAKKTLILGISRDSLKSHVKFIEKLQLPYDLISDQDEKICQLFDVLKMKKLYGKSYLGIERSTFLIDNAGILIHEWRNVKIKGHVEEVLTFL